MRSAAECVTATLGNLSSLQVVVHELADDLGKGDSSEIGVQARALPESACWPEPRSSRDLSHGRHTI